MSSKGSPRIFISRIWIFYRADDDETKPRHKKNRKVRLLRELYPDVNIKILYERDYRNLIWKYGLNNGEENNGNGDEKMKID